MASCNVPTGPKPEGWVLIWSDEFDYSGSPDPSKWTVLDAPQTPADNAFVNGSTLILRVDKNGAGANMGTGNTTSISYQGDYGSKRLFAPGRIDIRARAVLLPGIMNIAWSSTDWVPWKNGTMISGEIDFFEILGSEPTSVYMTSHLHLWANAFSGKKERISRGAVVREDDLDQFHVYTIEWDDTHLRMYLDGVLTNSRSYATDPESTIFTKPRPLILNVYHVPDGLWGFSEQDLDAAKLPADMKVDYVRYYQCPAGNCRPGAVIS